MASFKRAELRDILGEAYTEEIGSKIVALHLAVIDPMRDDLAAAKAETAKYKAEADKIPGMQKELDGYKSGEDFKAKYEAEHKALEDFKGEIKAKENRAKLEDAVRNIARAAGLSENGIQKAVKYTDYSGLKLNADGTSVENEDDLKKQIGEEWNSFKQTTETKGATVATPPAVGKTKMTKEEIYAIKNTAERQKAIAENHELFGF